MPPPEMDPAGQDEAHLVYLSMSAGSIHCFDSGLLAASVACLACTAFSLSTSLFLQLSCVRLAMSDSDPVSGFPCRFLEVAGGLTSSARNLLVELLLLTGVAKTVVLLHGWCC